MIKLIGRVTAVEDSNPNRSITIDDGSSDIMGQFELRLIAMQHDSFPGIGDQVHVVIIGEEDEVWIRED